MLIFDISGRSNKLWVHYFDNVDGLIYVIDVQNINKD